MPALKSAICLKEKHAKHPKTAGALIKLFKKWLSMSEEERLNACGKDARILSVVTSEIENLGYVSDVQKFPSVYSTMVGDVDSEVAVDEILERTKLNMRVFEGVLPAASWGSEATDALKANKVETRSVWKAIKVHKTLVKSGLAGVDNSFKTAAKEVFPFSTYFAEL